MRERHRQAVMALSVMLHEAQGVSDAERGRDIDIGGEVVTVRTVLDEYRAALAAATERAEAAEQARNRLRDQLDAIDRMLPAGISHEGADTDDRIRDLIWSRVNAIARADALAARLAQVDGEHPA